MTSIRSNQDFGNVAKIVNLPDPSSAQDAATKAYVDGAVEGLAWKDSVRVAAPANVNVASPGATIDGVTMATNDRVLLPNQTSHAEDGIYVWNGAAVAMGRALDANTAAELEEAIVTVEEGTSAGASFRQTVVNFTLGTTAQSWVAFGTAAPAASTGTAGVIALATQAEVDAGSVSNKAVAPSTLAAWSLRAREKVGTIGDGAATQYDVTHNWNTRNVQVEVYRNGTPWDTVFCDVSRPDANTIRFNFAAAPTASQFAYILHTGGAA